MTGERQYVLFHVFFYYRLLTQRSKGELRRSQYDMSIALAVQTHS
jgi:hypothetical protein